MFAFEIEYSLQNIGFARFRGCKEKRFTIGGGGGGGQWYLELRHKMISANIGMHKSIPSRKALYL